MIDRKAQIEWDNRAYDDYLERTGREKGLQEGLEKGLEQGRLEELISIVGNMLAKGMDIKIIAECVNLPEDKIIEIKTSMEKQ